MNIIVTPPEKHIARFHYVLLIISAVLYLFASLNSVGYYHPDEHYQIVEFGGLSIGSNRESDLPWEYASHIRPSLQPFIFVLLSKILNFIKISDPYEIIFYIRLISGFTTLAAIRFFVRTTERFVERELLLPYLIFSYMLWFIPLLGVRFSSETWSGICLLITASLVYRDPKTFKEYFVLGSVLGLSFLFRFQTAFVALGILAWMLIIKKVSIKNVYFVMTGIISILCVGTVLDYFFYRKWVLTPWSYFDINILKSVASNFGTSPWYIILKYIIAGPGLPIGLLLISALIVLIWKARQHMVLWMCIPFILIHMIVPHKEFRFLFPLAFFIPFLIVSGIQIMIKDNSLLFSRRGRAVVHLLVSVVFFVNLLFLSVAITHSAGDGRKYLTQYIYQNYQRTKVTLYHTPNNNPYRPYSFLREKFYENKNININQISSVREIREGFPNVNGTVLLILGSSDLAETTSDYRLKKYSFFKVASAKPEWSQCFSKYYSMDNPNNFFLYERKMD